MLHYCITGDFFTLHVNYIRRVSVFLTICIIITLHKVYYIYVVTAPSTPNLPTQMCVPHSRLAPAVLQ